LDEQIEIGKSQDEDLQFGVKAAEAVCTRRAQGKQANDTLHRLEPLLPKHSHGEQVQATTASRVAAQDCAAEQKLNQAKTALAHYKHARATTGGPAVKFAELELSYCKVTTVHGSRWST